MGPQARAVCSVLFLLQVLAEPPENSDFYLAGDYLLGGLFTLHANVKGTVNLRYLKVPKCKEYEMKVLGYNLMQAMRFAVEEINNHRSLLPGVLLGYEIVDICYVFNNVHPVLYFLAGEDYLLPIEDDYSSYAPRVVAVIGPDNSESTMTVAHFLSLFLLPQITYSAISDDLRDKLSFPAVLRTVLGAHHHMEAMVQLMVHFRWNWIIVLEVLPMPQPNQTVTPYERQRLVVIVQKLKQSTARVVVVFSPDLALHNFFLEVLNQNFTGAVWIASESWAVDPVLHNLTELRHTGTFLGVTTQRMTIPGFNEFRLRRAQARQPAPNRTSKGATCNQECDTCLDTTSSFKTILTLSGDRTSYGVYSAVYTVAHALHSLLGCNQTKCRKEVVYPWQLLQEIKKVNFTLLGHQIFFDQQGDLPVCLEIVQRQWDPSQSPFQTVASYHPMLQKLRDIREVSWHTPNNTVSSQRGWCGRGLRAGGGLWQSRAFSLFRPCPSNEWSHRNDTSCFKRRLVFLEWQEAPTIIVITLAALGFLSTLAIVVIFGMHFQTPMVRSAGGPMCFLMLTPLLVAYMMVPVYIGPPTVFSCLCRQAFFTICFTICISCFTVRSFQIVCIFKMASRLPRAYAYWVRYHGPYVFVAFVTALKGVIVAGNMLGMTTEPSTHADLDDPKIMIVSCNPNYRKALLLNTSLDLLLCVAGFSFAYTGRELPTNYNEAKFITFCMTFYFTSSISLCTFMSVYDGVLVTILDLLVTVLNLLGIGLGYFGPKCYMILSYPERNTQAYFNSMIQGFTMGRD
uniref:Taste receptor type 1 member 2 n=1 Tax=Equus caballus TaxID=9796 RepID=A0A3Q2GT45_HORSE